MLGYQLGYVDALGRPSSGAGKRFRPILALLACEGAGGHWEDALPLAAAIELVHNFSLIHDDIEDQDPTRRHLPTVWKVWGQPQAINAGDAMLALAGRTLAATSATPDIFRDLMRAFQDVTLDLTRGQYLDMSFEVRKDVTATEYRQMIELKSAALIVFSVEAGALLGGASAATRQQLRTFGLALGTAFQIRDDVLGIWSSQEITGKQPSKDLQNRKKTLPILLGAEHARGEAHQVLCAYLHGQKVTEAEVRQALTSAGAHSASEEVVEQHLRAALQALAEAGLAPSATEQLRALARELAGQR